MISAKKNIFETFADLPGQPNMPGEIPLEIEWSKPAGFFWVKDPELLGAKGGFFVCWLKPCKSRDIVPLFWLTPERKKVILSSFRIGEKPPTKNKQKNTPFYLLTPKTGVLLEWTIAMLVETHPTICISCIYTHAHADEITPWWESLCFSFFAIELRFFRNLATVKLALRWRAKKPRFWMGDHKRAGELSGTILRPTQKLFYLGTFGWSMKNQPR